MKVLLVSIFLYVISGNCFAANLTGTQTYSGKISSVAIGFYGQVGVSLVSDTCNGSSVVVLLNDNVKYKEILAGLLTAQTSGSDVKMYALPQKLTTFGTPYCVITEFSLGAFPLW